MITQVPAVSTVLRSSLRFQKAAFLAGSMAALATPSPAKADCVFGGPIGPGGQQFQGFLSATSNAATSAVTAMNTGFQTQTSAFVLSPTAPQPDQFASGLWGRAIGGRMDTDSISAGQVTRRPGDQFSTTCSTHTRNDFNGVQGGYDFGRLNLGASGWNAHVGVTGGFFETEATSQQGSGTTRAEVPFVGLYAALVNRSGFFIDAQVAAQFYNLDVSEPSISAQGSMSGPGIGITSSAGYNLLLGNNYFIEPSVGVVYSKVHLDPLNISPTVLGTPLGGRVVPLPSTLTLGDIETLPARASIRLGTTFDVGGVALQPFVAASVWHEFADNTTASAAFVPVFGSQTGAPGTFNVSSTRIGTFGQYSIGFSASMPSTGWLGYARVDYRNGENIESLSVNGGLRYQFAPAPQVAAAPTTRMYTKAPVAAPPQTWTGFYVGGFAGGAWTGDVTATEVAPGPGIRPFFNGIGTQASYGLGSSAIGGLTVGYNYQSGLMVAGLEAEGGYLRLTGSQPFAANPQTVSSTTIGDWYTALTGRLGFSMGPALIYGKGGAAIVDVTDNVIDSCVNAPPCSSPARTVAAAGGNRLGVTWVAGAGLEYPLSDKWSLKGEYLALGTEVSNTASGPGLVAGSGAPQTFNWRHDIPFVQTAKIGLNYKLSGL